MATLVEILQARIGKHGRSKAYVASELKVSEKTIENYMNGKRSPKPNALIKLSEILKFNLSELSEQNVPKERTNHAMVKDPSAPYDSFSKDETIAILVRQMANSDEILRRLSTVERLASASNELLRLLLGGDEGDQQAEERSAIEPSRPKRGAPSAQKGK